MRRVLLVRRPWSNPPRWRAGAPATPAPTVECPSRNIPPATTRIRRSLSSSSSSSSSRWDRSRDPDSETTDDPPLIRFKNARLAYPSPKPPTATTNETPRHEVLLDDFAVSLPRWTADDKGGRSRQRHRRGGIALIGRNGSGKTLVAKALLAAAEAKHTTKDATEREKDPPFTFENPYVVSGEVTVPPRPEANTNRLHGRPGRKRIVSKPLIAAGVSFESHRALLEETDERGDIVTAFKAIAAAGHAPGRLNPAARFLVVRFGLYPKLHQPVTTLSTGEIRKVLLARALSTRPSLLVLDQAFDGLDAPSRAVLRELVAKTIRGFANDLLVQGVSSKDTAERTQVVVVAQRPEELDGIAELDAVAWWGVDPLAKDSGGGATNGGRFTWNVLRRRYAGVHESEGASAKDTWSCGTEVLHRAMGLDPPSEGDATTATGIDWEDSELQLPSEELVQKWWNHGHGDSAAAAAAAAGEHPVVLVEADHVTIAAGEDRAAVTLLNDLTWTVRAGERWIVGGGNGAGKSTLSRLLAKQQTTKETDIHPGLWILPETEDAARPTIGWVSTESHMMQQQQQQQRTEADQPLERLPTTRDVLRQESRNASWEDAIGPVLDWLGIDTNLLDRPFAHLSQGQQKMVLIAAAVSSRPRLLILDEPCQGLDGVSRRRLLATTEALCRATDLALVYITHHLDEERLPSLSHALHLQDRSVAYKGPIEDYAPETYSEGDP